MRERLTTFVVVTLVSLTLWLYAEAESLGRETAPGRIEFISTRNDLTIRPAPNFDGRVTIELSGSKAALTRAMAVLEGPLRLEPGKCGLPDTAGSTQINLQSALQQYDALQRSGVAIVAVRPPTATIDIGELVEVQARIVPKLPSVEVGGEVTVEPAQAMLRVPKALAAQTTSPFEVIAAPTPDQVSRLPESGPVTLPVTLSLPDALRQERGAELITNRAKLTFSIRSTLVPATLPVPVQVLLPSIEQNLWSISIDPDDAILNVEVAGPADIINRLKSPAEGLVALLALSSDDLARGITTKPVGFAVLRQGVPTPLPESVVVRTPSTAVRFEATKRVAP